MHVNTITQQIIIPLQHHTLNIAELYVCSMYIHYVLLLLCSSGPTEDRILSPGWYVCSWKKGEKDLEGVEKWKEGKTKMKEGSTKSFAVSFN